MKILYKLTLAIVCLFSSISAWAQWGQTTLFEYPTAPDTCTTIESRCNYSVMHFWDKCDLTRPFEAKNDSLLLEAMLTYFEIMKAGANVNVSLSSVRDLMFKSQANHDNFLKLAVAAEYLLYYHDAELIDDLYMTFAGCVADAGWVKNDTRNHYREQVNKIGTSKLGEPILDFEYTDINGKRKHLTDNRSADAKIYLIIFGDGQTGSSIETMRLNTDIALGNLVESGEVKIINIITTDAPKQWDSDSQAYAATWEVGASKVPLSKLDMRIMPCVYILDEDFKVVGKNKTVNYVKQLVK